MWSVWLVFFDYGFHSICPLMDKNKRLMEASDGRDSLRGKLGLVLMGRAMLSKSLIQFSVDGRGCDRPTYGGSNEDNGNLLKKVPCTCCCTQSPDPEAGHHWPTPPLETPRHSQASLGQPLVGSLLLSSGSWCAQGSVCALQESVSLVLCKLWWLYGGVNGELLQEGLCHSHLSCTQSPCSCGRPLLICTSTGDTQIQFWLRLCGVSGSWCAQRLFEPSKHLWRVWDLILNMILPFLQSCRGFSFALGCWVSLFGGIQHSSGSGRSSGKGNGNPLQYSCLENPMDWGDLAGCSPWCHKSQTWLSI